MLKKINFISKIYANVMVVVMGVVIACSNIALDNAGAITAFLGQANQEIIQNPNSDIDTLYHPSDYESIEQLKENAKNITSKITEEGAVLLKNSNNEDQITESLYILDRMIDNGTKGIDKMYPVLSRFNKTRSANIQTFLAGIYRKIQVPDAFGPLVSMLIQNSINPQKSVFDPNEEIGGAILSYLSDRFRN